MLDLVVALVAGVLIGLSVGALGGGSTSTVVVLCAAFVVRCASALLQANSRSTVASSMLCPPATRSGSDSAVPPYDSSVALHKR